MVQASNAGMERAPGTAPLDVLRQSAGVKEKDGPKKLVEGIKRLENSLAERGTIAGDPKLQKLAKELGHENDAIGLRNELAISRSQLERNAAFMQSAEKKGFLTRAKEFVGRHWFKVAIAVGLFFGYQWLRGIAEGNIAEKAREFADKRENIRKAGGGLTRVFDPVEKLKKAAGGGSPADSLLPDRDMLKPKYDN